MIDGSPMSTQDSKHDHTTTMKQSLTKDVIEAWIGQSPLDDKNWLLAKQLATRDNPWFTLNHIDRAALAILDNYLDADQFDAWKQLYTADNHQDAKTIAVICAGNIPMVGFHDILCVLAHGHRAQVKLSHKDKYLLPALFERLFEVCPSFIGRLNFVDKLQQFDAVIATGSNNSMRYFDQYFGGYPHLFRNNRTSVAICHNDMTDEEVDGLVDDIMLYFGLGCRNVSKLFIPNDFDIDRLFKSSMRYSQHAVHPKYHNNFIYHSALYQMNHIPYLTNDLIILKEDTSLFAPTSVVHYTYYYSQQEVMDQLGKSRNDIQIIVTRDVLDSWSCVDFGQSQQPQLDDYADGKNTMKWLQKL